MVADGVVGPATLRRAGEILVGSESLSGMGRLALGIDYGTSTSDAPVEFGRGCTPGTMPAGQELNLVRAILDLQAQRTAALQTCYDIPANNPGRGMCAANVNTRFSELIGQAQDQLAAFCATSALTFGPSVDEPEPELIVDEAPDSTWLYVGGILGLLVVGGAVYYLARKKRAS